MKSHARFSESQLRSLAEQGLSIRAISQKVGRETSATKRALKSFGIKTHGKHGGDRKSDAARSGTIKAYINGMLPKDTKPLKQDECEGRAQWRELKPWPADLVFDSLSFRSAPARAPQPIPTGSAVGCATALCSEA